jgi:hypothetical protein
MDNAGFWGGHSGSLISSSITFFFHPKAYIWRRVAEKDAIKKKAAKIDVVKVQKVVTEDKLEEISKLLDRR